MEVAEPTEFFEQQQVAQQLAKFDASSEDKVGASQSMPMLVAVRVRPLWEKESDAGDYNTVQVLEGKVVVVLDPWYDADLNPNRAKEKKYAFDVVFDESVCQDEVYQNTARGLVGGVLDGYNSSVFAYGATGAGKTHTMLGSLEHPGVMVNTLHDMFLRMKEEFDGAKFKVTLQYMEIYNELIKDLLQPTSVDLKLNEDPVRGMVVQGITEYGADSADEILELLHRGNMHRAVEPTAANQVSSRSHAVLQITVEQSEATAHVTGNVRIGKLSMVPDSDRTHQRWPLCKPHAHQPWTSFGHWLIGRPGGLGAREQDGQHGAAAQGGREHQPLVARAGQLHHRARRQESQGPRALSRFEDDAAAQGLARRQLPHRHDREHLSVAPPV